MIDERVKEIRIATEQDGDIWRIYAGHTGDKSNVYINDKEAIGIKSIDIHINTEEVTTMEVTYFPSIVNGSELEDRIDQIGVNNER